MIYDSSRVPGWVSDVYFRSQVVQYAIVSIFIPSISLVSGFKGGALLSSKIYPQSEIPGWLAFICSTLYAPLLIAYLLIAVQASYSYVNDDIFLSFAAH